MARTKYQDRLNALRDDVTDMADTVLERYDDAIDAMETGDAELGESVIVGDHEINQLYLDLEGDCIELLALQQPVAGDLRFIAASFKIITDLERIGDLATNLARYGAEGEGELHPAIHLHQLADMAKAMVEEAMRAYEEELPDLCYDIADHDDDLDAACESASREILEQLIAEAPEDTDPEKQFQDASLAFLTIRDIERVGDHAVNIAARTLYMIENNSELIY